MLGTAIKVGPADALAQPVSTRSARSGGSAGLASSPVGGLARLVGGFESGDRSFEDFLPLGKGLAQADASIRERSNAHATQVRPAIADDDPPGTTSDENEP